MKLIQKKLANRIGALIFLVLISPFLIGCKSKKAESEEVIPAHILYDKGLQSLSKKDYKKAADKFEKIFFSHPGGPLTAHAELMQAYCLYMAGEYDEAVDILDIFIKLHPRHPDIAYAYYLKGLANYVQIINVKFDQSRTRMAKENLQEVVTYFPDTKYAIDASLKLDLVNDHLAGQEMLVGYYYQKQKNPIAAIKRFQTVVQEYQTTPYIQEVLYRLVECNIMLGLKEEAAKYASILGYNYPTNIWYRYSSELLKN